VRDESSMVNGESKRFAKEERVTVQVSDPSASPGINFCRMIKITRLLPKKIEQGMINEESRVRS
jgi:hypothetical protein